MPAFHTRDIAMPAFNAFSTRLMVARFLESLSLCLAHAAFLTVATPCSVAVLKFVLALGAWHRGQKSECFQKLVKLPCHLIGKTSSNPC